MADTHADILICGGGIIGLTIARELLQTGFKNVIIVEKEDALGKHASGRNSGVLHAGIYYAADSLRARSCLNGNFLMRQYCREKGLPLLESGKVIVAKNDDEIETLRQLHTRALQNGASVELIDEKQLADLEPFAMTCRLALYSPHTAVVHPQAILQSLYDDLISSGKVKILTKTAFIGLDGSKAARTTMGKIQFDVFINAAGSFSDKIAHLFGIGYHYKVLPFKGIYKKLTKEKSHHVKGNIYPVPDLRNPFLGVHFTRSISGDVYVGPTALPVLGREHYDHVKGIKWEAASILFREAVLFLLNPKFRTVALTEPQKYNPKFFYEDAKRLVKDLHPHDIVPSDKVGIRPQLVDWKKKELVMDYVVIKDGNSIHLLNTISPAFTASMDFAKFLIKNYI